MSVGYAVGLAVVFVSWAVPCRSDTLQMLGFPNICAQAKYVFNCFLLVGIVEVINIYGSLRNKASSPTNSGVQEN